MGALNANYAAFALSLGHNNTSLFEALSFTSKDAEQKFMLQFS
jgi:hypothetical protein